MEVTAAELKSYSAEYKTQGKMTLDGRKLGGPRLSPQHSINWACPRAWNPCAQEVEADKLEMQDDT